MKSITKLALVAATMLSGISATSSYAQELSEDQVKRLVEDYILNNPEVIVESLEKWRRDQQLAQLLPKLSMYRGYLENDPTYPVMGNPDGDVTIVEFFDYRCGFCKRHYPVMQNLVAQDGNIKYVTRQFPIKDQEGTTPVSYISAIAALASHKQGKYEQFHTAMINEPNSTLNEDRVYQIAGEVGLNVEQLRKDMRDPLFAKNIQNTISVARDLGLTGTPAYIIGNEIVFGAKGEAAIKQAVARARMDKKKAGGHASNSHNQAATGR